MMENHDHRGMNSTPTALAPELTAFAHAIPKLELHCHLLGTARKKTFIELTERSKAPRCGKRSKPSTHAAKS